MTLSDSRELMPTYMTTALLAAAMLALAALAFYRPCPKHVKTIQEATMQWASDTASWKGGWKP